MDSGKYISIFLLICSSAFGQGKVELNQFYPIDAGHSYIEFSITYMGYARVKGRFSDFSGMIRYDEKNPLATSASIAIKTESIHTDLEFRDNDLKSANWFDAAAHPVITFISTKMTPEKEGFSLIGDLTIKGVTHEVTLKLAKPSGVIKDIRGDTQVIFTGTTSLDRTTFGVEGKNWSAVKEGMTAVSKEVAIEVSVLGKQFEVPNYQNFVKFTKGAAGIYKTVNERGVDAGLTFFKKFVDEKTADVNMLGMAGKLLRMEGKLPEAKRILEANREAFPDKAEVYFSLGELALQQGDRHSVKMNFQEALRIEPTDVRAAEILRHL